MRRYHNQMVEDESRTLFVNGLKKILRTELIGRRDIPKFDDVVEAAKIAERKTAERGMTSLNPINEEEEGKEDIAPMNNQEIDDDEITQQIAALNDQIKSLRFKRRGQNNFNRNQGKNSGNRSGGRGGSRPGYNSRNGDQRQGQQRTAIMCWRCRQYGYHRAQNCTAQIHPQQVRPTPTNNPNQNAAQYPMMMAPMYQQPMMYQQQQQQQQSPDSLDSLAFGGYNPLN